jgi:Arc/MetJ-type ribon-helix-helix transcriptional regulator
MELPRGTHQEPAAARKYSVSIPEDIAEEARSRVGKGAFSAYVTAALRRQLERDRLAELVDESEQRLGPVPDTAQAQVAKEFEEAERRYAQWLDEQRAAQAS